jgi:hypothetical protein
VKLLHARGRLVCGSLLCAVGIEACNLSLNPTGEDPSYDRGSPPGLAEGPGVIPMMSQALPVPSGSNGAQGVPEPGSPSAAVPTTPMGPPAPVASAPAMMSTVAGGGSVPGSSASGNPPATADTYLPVVTPPDGAGQSSGDAGLWMDAASPDAGVENQDALLP